MARRGSGARRRRREGAGEGLDKGLATSAAQVVIDDELRTSAAHVVIDDPVAFATDDAGPPLGTADVHHLSKVLRLRPGQVVTGTDGAGRWRRFRWTGGAGAPLEPDGPVHVVVPPGPAVTVGFTPVKGDRPEWTVHKLTELGVERIIALRAARSVVRWDGERGAEQVQRLRRVAREATMQARRCQVPCIEGVLAPSEVPGAALAQFGGAPPSLDRPVVLVGPEGGWADGELASGAPTVSLGDLVLRAETAAVVAGSILIAIRQQLVVENKRRAW